MIFRIAQLKDQSLSSPHIEDEFEFEFDKMAQTRSGRPFGFAEHRRGKRKTAGTPTGKIFR
jgi:hypothetical protein